MVCKHCGKEVEKGYIRCTACGEYLYDFKFTGFGEKREWVVSKGPKVWSMLKLLIPAILLVPGLIIAITMIVGGFNPQDRNSTKIIVGLLLSVLFIAELVRAWLRFVKQKGFMEKNDVISFWKSLDKMSLSFVWICTSAVMYCECLLSAGNSIASAVLPIVLLLHAAGLIAVIFCRMQAGNMIKKISVLLEKEIEELDPAENASAQEGVVSSLNAADFGKDGTYIVGNGLKLSAVVIPVLFLVMGIFAGIAVFQYALVGTQFMENFMGVQLDERPVLMKAAQYMMGIYLFVSIIGAFMSLSKLLNAGKMMKAADIEKNMISNLKNAWIEVEKYAAFIYRLSYGAVLCIILFFIGAAMGHAHSLGGAIFASILLLLPAIGGFMVKKKVTEFVAQIVETMEKKHKAE